MRTILLTVVSAAGLLAQQKQALIDFRMPIKMLDGLDAAASDAAKASEDWRSKAPSFTTGSDGRVTYAFGAGLPVVVCAPLRVCVIQLEAGEKITGEPQIGDSVRWNVSPAAFGTGEDATWMVVIKPQEPGLDTNLLIPTDRRAYYLRLVSKTDDYVARVAFRYPEESKSKWKQKLIDQKAAEKPKDETLPTIVTAEKLNFAYAVKGGNEHIRPERVFDDGAKTFIQMRPDLQYREAPILLVLGPDGKGTMTNYRVRKQTYIVDRLFDRAQLVLGAGKKAQKVEIKREPRG